jgi:anti-sigma factor RsiW
MNCRSAESLFSTFVEDELSQEERRAIEAHLLGCRRCSLSVRELRETMTLVRSLPAVGMSAHFEEDVLARVRSGEALRPSVLEWFQSFLAPLRLRPVLAASAGVCAVAVAAVVLLHGPAPVGVAPQAPSIVSGSAPAGSPVGAPSAPATSGVPASGTSPGGSITVAAAPADPGAASPAPRSARRLTPSEIANLMTPDYEGATADSGRGLDRSLDARYQDEYILDQFLLERARGQRDPSIVPVGESANDDVYITF